MSALTRWLHNGGRLIALLVLFAAAAWTLFPQAFAGEFHFEGAFESRSTIDSTRKDFATIEYPDLALNPKTVSKAYDKSFVGTLNDLNFCLKNDFNGRSFLDFRETFHFQGYNPEDAKSFALDSYKYTQLDHLLNVTYGLAFGTEDAFRFDYFNNITNTPFDNAWDYMSNRGCVQFDHRISQYAGLKLQGEYEEREYSNDRNSNYQEGAMVLDLSQFIPERYRYTPIGNTTRGERSVFEKIPTGISTSHAVDYYTSWAHKPGDNESDAKYLTKVSRGNLFMNFTADIRSRKRVNIDNDYYQPTGIFKAIYDASDQIKLHFENAYSQRKFSRESDQYALYDHWSNHVSLGATNQPDAHFTHIITFSNEQHEHTIHKEQDYQINALLWETYFSSGKSATSLYMKESLTRYGQQRQYYADNDAFQAVLGYDYPITPNFMLHLKDEWIDTKYPKFADLYSSPSVRNSWRIALERLLSRQQGLEIGYQDTHETHSLFSANDIVEKSLFFNWLSHF
ncbi:MAG: hypothetical protein HQM09_22975 [Candidatus Riflebacteria bacterium]|nr:hypothetical protein [Candidatus Riflebacteria bacterium]